MALLCAIVLSETLKLNPQMSFLPSLRAVYVSRTIEIRNGKDLVDHPSHLFANAELIFLSFTVSVAHDMVVQRFLSIFFIYGKDVYSIMQAR